MGRWDTYLERIDEKTSRDDIKTALKNDNILIGCEFEFKVTDDLDASGGEASGLYDSAQQEADQYNMDVGTYEDDLEEYENETESLKGKLEEKQDRIDLLTDAISDQSEHNEELDEKITDANDDQQEAEAELKDHVFDKDAWVKEGNIDDWEKEERSIQNRISNAKVEAYRHTQRREKNDVKEEIWQNEINTLERVVSDMEDDVKYREEEGRYEQIDAPYPNEHNLSSYIEYMVHWMGADKDKIMYIEPGERLDYPPEWDGAGGDDGDFENAIEQHGLINSAPFDDYSVGEYGHLSPKPGSKTWSVENDTSLGSNGVEVKNPPMKISKFIPKVLSNMFDWIGDVGYTDNSCGFHCHMSLKTSESEIDYLKLALFIDEDWIYTAFEERAHSTFAGSVKDKIKKHTTFSRKDINDLFGRKKLMMKLQMHHQHNDAINLIDSKTGHVEFRYLGGSNYENKEKDVTAMIGMFAHNLSLAMDPEYKRKEYYLKLERIFNKMEMYYLEVKGTLIDYLITDDNKEATPEDLKTLYTVRKKTATRYKQLASVYKLDSRTRKMIHANTAFRRGVISEAVTTTRRGLSRTLQDRIHNQHPEALKKKQPPRF